MREIAGELPVAIESRVVAREQGIDTLRQRVEFTRVAFTEPPRLASIEPRKVAANPAQWRYHDGDLRRDDGNGDERGYNEQRP